MKTWGQILFLTLFIVFLTSSGGVAQRASAELISSLEPPSLMTGQNVKDGVHNVTYHNNILYVIDIWAGLQVVDVSDVNNPKEIGRFQNEHRARNLFIQGSYGYLADELGGVHVLDISNPRSIFRLGKIETLGDAWWVEANYPYVYVAEENKGIQVYDIGDIANPKPLGNYDTPGWAWGLNVQGDLVYVADKTGGLQIIDFTDKNNPVRSGQFQEPTQAKSIFIEDNYLFLTDGPNGLFILDISNPKFPNLVSKINRDGFIFDAFKGGKYLYMANEDKRRLEIINLTDINNPVVEASYEADDKIFGVWKEDVYVFVAANNKTLVLRHNSPPVLAEIESQAVDEMALLAITAEGYDPDGDQVYYEVMNLPEGAAFDSLNGIISWSPTYEQSGIYNNITIRIIERTASKLYTDRSFSITVNHVNRAPSLPEVENFTVNENIALSFIIEEGSDEDVEDAGRLSYLVENMPEGAVFDSLTRTFSWTPSYEQSGTYVMDFIIKDPPGALDRDASTITVIHIDRKPTIDGVAAQTANENQGIEIVITGNDPDQEDQNAITFKAQNLPEGANFNPQTRTFSWTPNYDQSGEYGNILFIMTAGNKSDSTITSISVVHVSRPPVLAEIGSKSIDENQSLRFSISGSDSDTEDQENLTFSVSNLPEGATFNSDSLTFSWTPNFDQSGNYSGITFTVTDASGLTDSKTIDIGVNHVNRTPELQDIAPVTSNEDVPITITLSGSDPDNEDQSKIQYQAAQLPEGANFENNTMSWNPGFDQSGEYTIEFSITDGQLTNTKSAVVTINHVNRPPAIEPIPAQIIDENKPLEIKIVGSDPDTEDTGKWTINVEQLPEGALYNAETATITWTPNYDQAGEYTLKITNSDAGGLTAQQDVQITVNHVNRTPSLDPVPPQTGEESAPVSVIVPPGVDPDVEDAQKLTYTSENLPEGATFDPATRTLTWTPGFDQSGEYEIIIKCSDGEFTVTQPLNLTITHVNRPPELEDITPQTVDEDQVLNVQIGYSDPDTEDDGKLQIIVNNLPAGAQFDNQTGTLQWTPTYDDAGTYSELNVVVTDPAGLKSEKSFSITVNNINRPPEITDSPPLTGTENLAISHTFSGNDPDKEDQGKLQFSSDNLPAGASLDAASGVFSWTPNYTQAGNYTINIQISDPGGLSSQSSLEITVANVNRPPTLQNIENKSVDENSSIDIPVAATDEDTDDELLFSATGLPSGASINESDGTISWQPDYNQAGDYTITVKVSDGEAEAASTFSISVIDVNRSPSISGGGSVTVLPGEAAELSFSASDEDNDQLTYESSDLPGGASLDSATGEFRWTPDENQVGTHNFTVQVSDGKATDQTSGTVIVNEPPPPPAPEQPDQN